MNEFVEAAKKKAAEKKELRNKMRDEAMKFVDEYKKENGNKSFISLSFPKLIIYFSFLLSPFYVVNRNQLSTLLYHILLSITIQPFPVT